MLATLPVTRGWDKLKMRKIMNYYPIGIDMDDRRLTAAQFHETRQGLRLRGLFSQPLAPPAEADDDQLVAALKSVVSCRLFKGRRAVFNIPFRDLTVFPVHCPLGEGEDPEEAILREAPKLLPYPLEEAIIDYPSFMGEPGTCDATVVAVRRQIMVRWLGILRRAGLRAEAMEFSISSLIRLHRSLFQKDGRANLLCHIGRTHSLLAVASDEGLISLSEVSWGIEPLWGRIRNQLKLPETGPEAPSLLKMYGLAYAERETMRPTIPGENQEEAMNIGRVIFQIIAPAIDELIYEVHKTVGYMRSLHDRAVFGEVYLYGLAGMIYHLDHYLENHTGIQVRNVEPPAGIGYPGGGGPDGIPGGVSPVPAIGLAMREVSWL